MSSVASDVNQDALDALAAANCKAIGNLGYYESIGKAQGACGKGLVFLQTLIIAILTLCPQCHITKTQWRAAILDANRMKDFNSSGLGHRIWAGQRAERLLTLTSHLRRIFREPQRLIQACKTLSPQNNKILRSMVDKIVGDATMACDSENDCPSPQASRTLKRHASQESAVSCDSTGMPNFLSSPKEQKTVVAVPSSPVQQNSLADADDYDDDAPASNKKPAAATAGVKKKPAAKKMLATSTSTVTQNVKDLFTLKINYASAQSYIHIIMPDKSQKIFITGKTTDDHQSYIKQVASKLKATAWTKPITAEKVKNAVRLITAYM